MNNISKDKYISLCSSSHREEALYYDALGWDTENWSRGLKYLEKEIELKDKKVLELGCGGLNGGLSLWAACKGAKEIICSTYGNVINVTREIHRDYNIDFIKYSDVNALDIPYENEFDLIMFKSMLGGIARENFSYNQLVLKNCAKALKAGGLLIFAENLTSTYFHSFFRKKIKKMTWHYYELNELENEIKKIEDLEIIKHKEFGFIACFGINEKQRIMLGKLDSMLEKLCPDKWKYIQFWIIKKK